MKKLKKEIKNSVCYATETEFKCYNQGMHDYFAHGVVQLNCDENNIYPIWYSRGFIYASKLDKLPKS
jgi:hypothetical protein